MSLGCMHVPLPTSRSTEIPSEHHSSFQLINQAILVDLAFQCEHEWDHLLVLSNILDCFQCFHVADETLCFFLHSLSSCLLHMQWSSEQGLWASWLGKDRSGISSWFTQQLSKGFHHSCHDIGCNCRVVSNCDCCHVIGTTLGTCPLV